MRDGNCDSDGDVSALRKEASELKRELKKQNGTKKVIQTHSDADEYFCTISHELKTPIREIELYAKFVEEDNAGSLTPESVNDLRMIRQTCHKMIDMIHRFMEYSKAEKRVLNREAVRMKPLIQDCFSDAVKRLSGRSISLEISELPELIGDLFLIRQMVNNILSNCVKFTQNVSDAKVKVFSYEESESVNFCFEDNGIGFDMRYAANIFRIFERIHNECDYEGHGIGLATVKKIVERFEGDVDIFGRVNHGCIVTIKFPKSMVITKKNNWQTPSPH